MAALNVGVSKLPLTFNVGLLIVSFMVGAAGEFGKLLLALFSMTSVTPSF